MTRQGWNSVRVLLVGFCLSSAATAYPIIFATGPTTTTGGAQVNATASFTFDTTAHSITIQLLNLQLNPRSVAQLISGVEFDLTNLSGSVAPSINSATVGTFDVDGNGNPVADSQSTHWVTKTLGSNSVSLCEICKGGGGNGPSELIIGGPDPATGTSYQYTNAAGSIAGNGPHNPFILGSGAGYSTTALKGLNSAPTWVISVPQLTITTGISQVRFFFGTTYGADEVVDNSFYTPEPGPAVLIGGGLALIALGRVSRKKR